MYVYNIFDEYFQVEILQIYAKNLPPKGKQLSISFSLSISFFLRLCRSLLLRIIFCYSFFITQESIIVHVFMCVIKILWCVTN